MPRTQHSLDGILDAARDVVSERGIRGATLDAIAEASGAPTGSIYYRFPSVDELLARLWIRAVRRTHELVRHVVSEDAVETVVAGALELYDYCLKEREDAVLLGTFRSTDFARADLSEELRIEVERVNQPVEEPLRDLARALFGKANPANVDLVLLALVDLPHGFARRHLDAGTIPPRSRRDRLEGAVRSVLAGGRAPQ